MSSQRQDAARRSASTPESERTGPSSLPRIDRKYVHKHEVRNVLLARVERLEGHENRFEAELTPDWTHPAFFEHPVDHVPSMMFVEAARQMVLAFSHMYLDVPIGMAFVVASMQIRFSDFADIHVSDPVLIRAEVADLVRRHGRLQYIRVNATFHQGERQVGEMGGEGKVFTRETYERLRQRRLEGA